MVNAKYSPLNCYQYDQKPRLISAIDYLSAPLRNVLGGRTVNVQSATYNDKKSVVQRVMLLMISVLIFPVALFSLSSLLIKLAIMPFKWDQKKISEITAKTSELVDKIQKAAKDGNLITIENELSERPALIEYQLVRKAVALCLSKRIKENACWDKLFSSVLSRLPEDSRRDWIDYAVDKRLKREAKSEYPALGFGEIKALVEGVLLTNQSRISCYKKLIKGSVQINPKSDDFFMNIYKLDLIRPMIAEMRRLSQSAKASELNKEFVKLKLLQLESKAVKGGTPLSSYVQMLKDDTGYAQLHQRLNQFKALASIDEGVRSLDLGKEKWLSVMERKKYFEAFNVLVEKMKKSFAGSTPFELDFRAAFSHVEKFKQCLTNLWADPDAKQRESIKKEMDSVLKQFAVHSEKLLVHFTISTSLSSSEQILFSVEMKIRVSLLVQMKNLWESLVTKGIPVKA